MEYIDRLKMACGALIDEAEPIVCHDGDREYVVSDDNLEELRMALASLESEEFI